MAKGYFKGFNDYKVIGDTTIIYFNYKNEIHECLIDTEDLNKFIEADYRWSLTWAEDVKSFYANTSLYFYNGIRNKKCRILAMHRFVLGYEYGDRIWIDHVNHNTMDNRKSNLKATKANGNTKNRKGRNSNNKSGYRNVIFSDGWYIVQLQIEGKNKRLGKFKDVHEAGKFAEEMRLKYYGEFAGNG
jgi:hypothetical protein